MARGLFKFWLDFDKDEELLIAEEIDHLKKNRTFTKTIRDGIRLIGDLRRGRVAVLFELFPWVKAEFLAGVQPPVDDRLLQQLKRIEHQLIEQGNTPIHLPARIGGPKPISVPQLSAPNLDEDDHMLIKIKQDTSTDSVQNFLNSVFALQE